MFDLHSHILPAIDDGAQTMEETLAMLQIAVDCGTDVIIATPHVIEGVWLPEWEEIVTGCHELTQAMEAAGIGPLAICPGAEVALNMDILARIPGPGQYCINSSQYMLIELPATHIPQFADEFFFTLQARGITPIVAHPERHPELGRNPHILLDWINKGILAQINGTSITGRMGERIMKTAELFLTNGMAHVIGSDAHSPHHRTPRLTETKAKLHKLVGKDYATQLLITTPHAIINNEYIPIREIHHIRHPQKPKIYQRFFATIFG